MVGYTAARTTTTTTDPNRGKRLTNGKHSIQNLLYSLVFKQNEIDYRYLLQQSKRTRLLHCA